MGRVLTGLERLVSDKKSQSALKGNIGYLCHSASVNANFEHGIALLKNCFGSRLKKLFSPQHGLYAEEQDNMIESDHFFHPFYQLPVYSLYSETRKPTDNMLDDLDTVLVDLQDVGTRIYTFIYTLTLMMESCSEKGIEVVVLDRPNPINGVDIEGNILDPDFRSFIGLYPMPMRHGMTIGEVAQMANKYWGINCILRVVSMKGWERKMNFFDTGLPWILPSPNLPTIEGTFVFPGSVLFEGTNLSEGRGTTRSLEIIGSPKLDSFNMLKELKEIFKTNRMEGFALRPLTFIPTFNKHEGKVCQGFQIHPTELKKFQPWKVGQLLCQTLYHFMGEDFQWKNPPYEYEYKLIPIDILNGTDKLRLWVESNGSFEELDALEKDNSDNYMDKRKEILLY
jgi:uncharacterized protein YbbC (DUF1343 family)